MNRGKVVDNKGIQKVEVLFKDRVYAYIDNFNFYHAIKKEEDVKWIDWQKLIKYIVVELLGGEDKYSIEHIKYFTAEVDRRGGKGKSNRQKTYWDAIEYENPKVEKIEGRFIWPPKEAPVEKETDVRIALNIEEDARENKYDTALIVSGDGDFVPVLEVIKEKYHKEVIIAFPSWDGASGGMQKIADKKIFIEKIHLKECLFPPIIQKEDGGVIKCPETWKWQTENNE